MWFSLIALIIITSFAQAKACSCGSIANPVTTGGPIITIYGVTDNLTMLISYPYAFKYELCSGEPDGSIHKSYNLRFTYRPEGKLSGDKA